ncbi:MAG: hypothetical protein AAB402_02740 [Patescibacteria group bacterium]
MRWSNFFHIYQPPAWDEVIIRRACTESYEPLVSVLRQHPEIKITLNITGALIDQLSALGLGQVLTEVRQLAERGQIELVGSAKYHPILPLLPPEEVVRQIELQEGVCRNVFGPVFAPQGFYAPEMAYSSSLEKLLLDRGYRWVILDEICSGQPLGAIRFNKRFVAPGGLGVIFRNRYLSDFLSFSATIDQPEKSVAAIQQDVRSVDGIVTAMDGENLGHHRAGVDRLWEILVTWPEMETETLSEYRRRLSAEEIIAPHDGSWSSQPQEMLANVPFGLWNHPENPIHKLQWQLTHQIIAAVRGATDDPTFDVARRLLDQALTSDKYWWASASPWWDMTIVIRETQRLVDVLSPLTRVQPKIMNTAERLMKQVATTVELWEKTGLAKRRQATYLHQTGDVRYMGGQRLVA